MALAQRLGKWGHDAICDRRRELPLARQPLGERLVLHVLDEAKRQRLGADAQDARGRRMFKQEQGAARGLEALPQHGVCSVFRAQVFDDQLTTRAAVARLLHQAAWACTDQATDLDMADAVAFWDSEQGNI